MLLIAEVVKSHGLRGEVCIESFADSPFLYDEVPNLFLAKKGKKPRRFVVQSTRRHKGRVLLTLKGIDGRDQADALRGMEVYVHKHDLPELSDDDFYLHDIEGAQVSLEDGTQVGTIDGFILSAAQEVWRIKTSSGGEVMLPAVEEFVVSVDVEAGKIVIDPPEGLLDLYLKSAEK